jgi:hypothetical protein
MAIKNKDGSIYCYSKPNPVMNSQSLWPKSEEIKFHNKFGQRTYSQPEPEKIKVEIKEAGIVIEKSKESTEKDVDVFDVWCLPATVITKVDPLYGSNYNRIKYGDKFTFEAKVYETTDLYLKLITKQEVPENSVIFPLNTDRRWWRIKSNESYGDSNFWIVTSQISDYQPNFIP